MNFSELNPPERVQKVREILLEIEKLNGKVVYDSTGRSAGAGGYFSPRNNALALVDGTKYSYSTLLHEFQHFKFNELIPDQKTFDDVVSYAKEAQKSTKVFLQIRTKSMHGTNF